MKQKFLFLLVLLLTATTGAWAQTTYKVSVKEGTEDAKKWTIDPTEAAAGSPVTATYSGEKKVKSVKAVKKEVIKPDLLAGVFSVSSTKKVNFSKGNLQATYDGSSWTWAFANNQWDYIGNSAGNTKVTDVSPFISENGTVDLFGWVGASSTWTGAAQYGISNSTATNNVDGYGNVGGEAQKVGWGATVGAGWRTLTKNEWLYLLSERATGVTVNSTDNARYTQATINTDGMAVKGLIIFPDSYAGGSPAGVTWGTINAKSTFETTCTSAGWTALEAAGCVFLPVAGYRDASTVKEAGVGAGYWSSSSSTAPYAFALYFESDYMTIQYGGSRKYGFSVRLVQAAPITYPIALSAVTADYIGSVVTSDGNVYPAKTAVPAGKTAVGIVGKVTETGHGLILALENATDQEWNTINGWTSETNYAGTTLKVLPDNDARGSLSSYTTLGTTAVSNWAVAQKSDYEAIFTNLGSTQSDGFNGTTYDDNVNAYITTGVDGLAILGYYWSATEESDYNESWNFYNYCWTSNRKSTSYFVRPVLGF